MGQLDQFAKQLFEEETSDLTGGAVAWQTPTPLGLLEVRLDGLLLVREPGRLPALPAPWSLARASDEIVLELKMPGDHLDPLMLERALLRRQARQVRRMEAPAPAFSGQEPLWLVAPHVPRWLRDRGPLRRLAPGCYRLERALFPMLWVAANELPLHDALVPFLVARSGRALDAFARWVAPRRPFAWVMRMVRFLPMSTTVIDELLRFFPEKADDAEVIARKRHFVRGLLRIYPDLGNELVQEGIERGVEKGIEKGIEQALVHQYERRLARPLTEAERQTLHERLGRLGPDRLGDVVLERAGEALAAWLADPDAS
jgi:hypothetical protein